MTAMFGKNILSLISFWSLLWSFYNSPVHAQRMDIDAHDMVISKLEGAVSHLDKRPEQKLPIILRLADLYSDRARMKYLTEVDQHCDNCLQSQSDRRKALNLYQSIFESLDTELQGKILVQMAHLHQILNEHPQAIALFKRVINGKQYPRTVVGLAHTGLGEVEFQRGRYKQAQPHYEQALKIKETPRRGFVTYRLAWCHLNQGRRQVAINTLVSILKSPELLKLTTSDGVTLDPSFHEDVSRDLATFLARGSVGPQQIRMLSELSPSAARRANLFFLGTETDRLGQKKASVLVWKTYLAEGNPEPLEALEIQIRMAQLEYDLGRKSQALIDYDKAVKLWEKHGCHDEIECEGLQVRLRNFPINWNKAEKRTPSRQILTAYTTYTRFFTQDIEMHYWAALLARELKDWQEAHKLYRRSSVLAHQSLQNPHLNESLKKDHTRIFEGALLGEIEVAEASNNLDLKAQAYDHYLALNPQGNKHIEVRYQRAQVEYARKNYDQAAQRFRAVALIPEKSDFKEQAADLALDSLVLNKNDAALESWGKELAEHFPKRRNDFLKISRTASINLVASTANNPSSSDRDLQGAHQRLVAVPLAGASDEERITYFKNRLIIAEKTRNLQDAEYSANELLKIRSLSETDKELAMASLVWVSEMQFDFTKAYNLSRRMKLSSLAADDRELRLGILAELAGRNPTAHYQEFIKLTRSKKRANLIRARLVRRSSSPWAEMQRMSADFRQTPDIYASLALETFARFKNYGRANEVLNHGPTRRQPEGQSLYRYVFFRDYQNTRQKISQHRINAQSDRLMQNSIKRRMDLLKEVEELANKALQSKDWTLQLITLHLTAQENQRLYNELMALPVPRQLNAQQREEYQALLQQQAQPYLNTAQQVTQKVNDFWSNRQALTTLENDYKQADPEMQKLIKEEIEMLASLAPNRNTSRHLARMTRSQSSRPSRAQILSARQAVQQDPFNLRRIHNLKTLEEQAGGETMVAYLDARLTQLQQGGQ